MKMVSWNVNGLRAIVKKNFYDFFKEVDADIFCIQESKLQAGQIEMELPGYHCYFSYAEKKGYSGTAIFSKEAPLSVTTGLGIPEMDTEGRVVTLEFEKFYMVDVYTPNIQSEFARMTFRMAWDDAFRIYLNALDAKKPEIGRASCRERV